VYTGGDFTTAGGVSANRVARWDGSSWSALGSGMNTRVTSLQMGRDGSVYAGGGFTTAGGVTANRVARWNGTAWSALGSGANDYVFSLQTGADGDVYAGGFFTTAGGGSASHIAKWNGIVWSPLGGGTSGNVTSMVFDTHGDLVLSGPFSGGGGVYSPYVTLYDMPGVVAEEGGAAGLSALALSVRPNPVSTSGTVYLSLPEASHVRVTAYDMLGRQVAVLTEGERSAGEHDMAFDVGALVPGVYVIRLDAGGETAVRRVTVVR
jgi:hypothetical protein